MGDKIILTVEEIININEAVMLIAEKETLSATTVYRLGRLKKYADGVMKEFTRAKNYKIETYNKAVSAEGITDEQKIQLRQTLEKEIESLIDVTEEITVPELRLSDFIDENGKLTVPQKFIFLMGELIKDDQHTGDYSTLIRKEILAKQNGHE